MTGAVAWGVFSYLCFCAGVIGFFWVLIRKAPVEPFTDPSTKALREDREVETLDAIWDMPSFDPRETA